MCALFSVFCSLYADQGHRNGRVRLRGRINVICPLFANSRLSARFEELSYLDNVSGMVQYLRLNIGIITVEKSRVVVSLMVSELSQPI